MFLTPHQIAQYLETVRARFELWHASGCYYRTQTGSLLFVSHTRDGSAWLKLLS